MLLRGKEVIENFVWAILWQPGPEIAHAYFSDIAFVGTRANNDAAFSRRKSFHGIERVNDQVKQDLLNLNQRSLHLRKMRIQLSRDHAFPTQYVRTDEPYGV